MGGFLSILKPVDNLWKTEPGPFGVGSLLPVIVLVIALTLHTLVVPCGGIKAVRKLKSGHGIFLSLVNDHSLSETI